MTQVAWKVCGVSFLGDIQKSRGHGAGHAALNGLADTGWTTWVLEIPSNLNYSMILKIHFTLHATNILQKEKMGQNPLKERWEFDVS